MHKHLEHEYVFIGRSEDGEVKTVLPIKTTTPELRDKFQKWKSYNQNPVQELYKRLRRFET